MALSMASLLVHEAGVPAPARVVLKAAIDAPPGERADMLRSAAQILFHETDLECADVRELLDLESGPCE
jgi:hypothetical protein